MLRRLQVIRLSTLDDLCFPVFCMWTEYTENVIAPEIVTPQQMEEQPKAEYHPELEAREMPTEVPNPVQRNSKEFLPPNSKNYCTLSMHISVNLMTEDNEVIIIS